MSVRCFLFFPTDFGLTAAYVLAGMFAAKIRPPPKVTERLMLLLLHSLRSGESFILPPGGKANMMRGNGKFLYVSGQLHILTNVEMRNCGYRSPLYNQYDNSSTRGCGDNITNGCTTDSYVFYLNGQSDKTAPQMMLATKNITFTSCGRRYDLGNTYDTSAGRSQNVLDVDGTFSGLNVPAMVGSGDVSPQAWWEVDNEGKQVFELHGSNASFNNLTIACLFSGI